MTTRRDTLFLLLGSATQDLAFRVAQVALPLVVLTQTGSVALTGLVAGAEGLPVLSSPWWARRARQWVSTGRRLAYIAVLDAAALAIVPTAAAVGQLSAPVLIAAGLLLGVGETLGGPGRAALLTEVGDRVGPDRASTLLIWQDLLRRTAMIAGPALGALGVAAGLTNTLLWIQSGSVLVAGVLAWPVQGYSGAEEHSAPLIRGVLADRPDVLAGWLMRGTNSLTWFAFTLGLAVLGVEQGRPGLLYASGMIGYGAGALLGTVVAMRVVHRMPVLQLARTAWTVTGVAWVLMAARPTVLGVAGTAALSGAFTVVGISAVNAAIVTSSAGAARRTLLSGQTVVVSATSSVGMLAGGAVIGAAGVRPTLVAAGLLGVLVANVVPRLVRRRSGVPGRVMPWKTAVQ